MNSRMTRRRLAPGETYEICVSVLTGQAAELAAGCSSPGRRHLAGVGSTPSRVAPVSCSRTSCTEGSPMR